MLVFSSLRSKSRNNEFFIQVFLLKLLLSLVRERLPYPLYKRVKRSIVTTREELNPEKFWAKTQVAVASLLSTQVNPHVYAHSGAPLMPNPKGLTIE